jgi:PAS domain-containing protein
MNQSRNSADIFYANIIDSVGDGVIVLDAAGVITLMNPAAEEITVCRAAGQGNGYLDFQGPTSHRDTRGRPLPASISDQRCGAEWRMSRR